MKELTFDSIIPGNVLVAYDYYSGSIPFFYMVLEKKGKSTIVIRRLKKTGQYNVGASDGVETPVLGSFNPDYPAMTVRFNKHGHVCTPGRYGMELRFWDGRPATYANYN